MRDWKELLGDIVRAKGRAPTAHGPKEARLRVERFLGEVAEPAFRDLHAELERHGRQVRIARGPDEIALTVLDPHGHEEFHYRIVARSYRPASFAFPEFDTKEGEGTSSRAEVLLRSGPASHDVAHFDREQLIRHFLHEYRKWIGWHSAGDHPY